MTLFLPLPQASVIAGFRASLGGSADGGSFYDSDDWATALEAFR